MLDNSDKFAKVRPLLDSINEKCIQQYPVVQNISVEESMVPYFGKHGAEQYIHGKPIKVVY